MAIKRSPKVCLAKFYSNNTLLVMLCAKADKDRHSLSQISKIKVNNLSLKYLKNIKVLLTKSKFFRKYKKIYKLKIIQIINTLASQKYLILACSISKILARKNWRLEGQNNPKKKLKKIRMAYCLAITSCRGTKWH